MPSASTTAARTASRLQRLLGVGLGLLEDLLLGLAGDLQVGVLGDALVRERVQHALPQLARAGVDERVGHVDLRVGDDGVEHRLAELGLDLRARRPRAAWRAMSSRSSSSVSKPPASSAKSSSSSGSSLRLTSLTVTANSASLPARCSAP